MTEAEKIAVGLTNKQRKALLTPGLGGVAELGERGIDRLVHKGLLAEFDFPTLAGCADEPHWQEMRRLGLALVVHSWTPLAEEVRQALFPKEPEQ